MVTGTARGQHNWTSDAWLARFSCEQVRSSRGMASAALHCNEFAMRGPFTTR